MVRLPITEPELSDGAVQGTIDTLDVRYGSLWTSIPAPCSASSMSHPATA